MFKVCLHCGIQMESLRNTKKYCSDHCKQAAFYKRNAVQLTSVSDPFNVTEAMVQEDTTITDSYNNHKEVYHLPITEVASVTVATTSETAYETIQSSFIERVTSLVDNSEAYTVFQSPHLYWGTHTTITVQWVSLRCRCLLENILLLSQRPSVSYDTLNEINKALEMLTASFHFRLLPSNYPYTALISELHLKLTHILKPYKRWYRIRFRITPHRKAELIAARFCMAGFVPAAKFEALDFSK